MNERDWAIVVGVGRYVDPTLQGLEGPERDAVDFYDWVTSEEGGGVPAHQAKKILSSDSTGPEATPTADLIQSWFDHLETVDEEFRKKERKKGAFGRRLWIFFAGHGFAPDLDDKLTALLTADAKAGAFERSHVVVSKLAEFCQTPQFFDEIFLFADCCRTRLPVTQLNVKRPKKVSGDADKVRTFYAYGARIGKESREWKYDGTTPRGVFTLTLMEGLRGAAVDRSEKRPVITAESLNNFLHNNFVSFMVPRDLERPGIRREPEVVFEHRAEKLVIGPLPGASLTNRTGTSTKYRVFVKAVTPGVAGAEFRITRRAEEWTGVVGGEVDLEAGLYVLSVPSLYFVTPFEVQASRKTIDVDV